MQPFREINYRTGEPYERYRGHVQRSTGGYCKVVLFTDLALSRRELTKLQRDEDEHAHDSNAAGRKKHAARPILEHVGEFVDYLKRTTKSADHPKIQEGMLQRAVVLGGWKRLADITLESMEANLAKLRGLNKAMTYRNGYIKAVKAFVHWCMPDRLSVDPLTKLRRGSTVRADQPRKRRAATLDEVRALFRVIPEKYHLKVGFMILTGFRRKEAKQVAFDDLRLNAPIPFIQLRQEWTKTAENDALPLHAALVERLRSLPMTSADSPIFPTLPEVETLEKYWKLGGVEFKTKRGRLDLHAFRHTFSTWLDEANVSWTSKKALTRHARAETADGYSHARIGELSELVNRLPSPWPDDEPQALKMTGTDPAPIPTNENSAIVSAQLLQRQNRPENQRKIDETDKSTWVPGREFPTLSAIRTPIKCGIDLVRSSISLQTGARYAMVVDLTTAAKLGFCTIRGDVVGWTDGKVSAGGGLGEEHMEAIGPKLRRQRRRLGLTLDELAGRTGISKPYLSLIETGRVLNPPSDEKLRRLEQTLGFVSGELVTQAHLERTPRDVREMLHRLLKSGRGGKQLTVGSGQDKAADGVRPDVDARREEEPEHHTGRQTLPTAMLPVNLDEAYLSGALQELVERSTGNIERIRSNAVPVINKVSAGYPKDFTDLSYPRGIADEYISCPDVDDKDAFAARVWGDSMDPKYREGDIVIFSPLKSPRNGDDCFVRFEDGTTTFKRIFFENDEQNRPVIRLQPRNEKYAPKAIQSESVTGLYKAVYKYQNVEEG